MMKRLMTLGVFLSSICGQPSLFADAGSMALGMEEGFYTDFNVNVSVVSKKSESLSEAPGVVTVITADEIKKMGYDTINDVISTVPGVTVTESYWGSTSFSFRGLRENHYNNRTLLLLNGTPIRNVTVGQYVLEGIPVNSIDRIEIIRGPGSVIYGNGGFAGVIKVITKDKVNTTGVAAMGGSKKTSDVAIEHGRSMGGINYYVAGSVRNSDGYKATAKDESGLVRRSGQYDKDQTSYEDDYDNAFGSFSLGGLKMGSYHFTQVKDKMGITPSHITTGFTKMRMSGASASYEHKIGALEVKPGAYYEWTYYKTYMDHFPAAASPPINQLYSGRRFGADLDGRIDLTESISGLTGMSFERQDTNPYEFRDLSNGTQSVFSAFLIPYHTYDMSAFAQLEVAPVAPLKIVGGVRYNNNMEYGATAVPRVNAVFKAAENLTVKAQYGQAYRNPTFFEKYVNTKNVLYGDPDLKPEKINTVELASDWFTKQRSVRFTFFNETTSNLIDRVKKYVPGDVPNVALKENRQPSTLPSNANGVGYANTTGQKINGAELEVRGLLLGKTLTYNLNGSYKDGVNKVGKTNIQFLDRWTANAILGYSFLGLVNTMTFQHIGDRKGNIDPASPAATVAATGLAAGSKIRVPAMNLVHWKTSYAITKNWECSLTVRNLFKDKVQYPEFIRRRIDVVPGDSGRNIFVGTSLNF